MDLADGVNDDSFSIDKQTLSRFDTIQLFTYSMALFIGGVIGDIFDIRKLLTTAFSLLGFAYFLLGLGGMKQVESYFYFYFVFFLIGLFSSILWPTMIHMMGNWYSKKNRGLIIGAWATCANIGNIIGIQLAAILIDAFDGKWENLIFINAATMITMAVLIWIWLVPHPARIGLEIQEEDE
jgi:sugar phosphate permease